VKYRTTCPQCTSIFRLGADQLDAAQGWVQCSVCGAAFDARPSLLMEDGSPLPVASEPAATLEVPTVEAPVAESMLPGEAATASQPVPDMAEEPAAPTGPEAEPQAAEPPVGIAQREEPPDLPSIIIIDPNIPVTEDYGPLPQMYPPPTRPAPGPYAPVYTQAATVPAAAPLPPKARIEYSPPRPATARGASAPRRISAWVWGLASALLLVTLLAQTTYFLRDTLVSRFPQIRPAFEQACTVLGCTLSLPKNLALLQIVGSDLQTEASGRLKLTLTLGNRASHVQAWPVLVLTLTDQRNRPLARRSFAPSEYLDDPRRIAAGMPPRSEQPLILPLTVQDLAPMGFDLQLVY
jgi:predicted Zn finger-like uncharacterized protein